MARDRQEYDTTTRAGQKVKVIHGKTGNGDTRSIVGDGWGYETAYHEPKRKK